MLESFNTDNFTYQKLSLDEQQSRGILGRLKGVIADTVNPTRNGRKYSAKLWEKVFADPIMQEKIQNRCLFGELGHPADREETDMEKIALCLAEQPKKGKDGKLYGVFDILNTPNGRILKTLCDYGCNIGISSRGSGDLITDMNGDEAVDEDTYDCQGFDAVLVPAVKEARLAYVTEALNKVKYNKSLKTRLQESLDRASADDKKVMKESLKTLGVRLNEDIKHESDDISVGDLVSFSKKGMTDIPKVGDDVHIGIYFGNCVDETEDSILVEIQDILNQEADEDIDNSRYEINHKLYKDDADQFMNEETLNEAHKNELQEVCEQVLDYFDEVGYPIKSDAWWGADSWKDVKDGLTYIPAELLETAEGLMEELQDYITTTDRIIANYNKGREERIDREPFSASDDPDYSLFSEWLRDLKYNFDLYVKENGLDESLDINEGLLDDRSIKPGKEFTSKSGHKLWIDSVRASFSPYDGTPIVTMNYHYKLVDGEEGEGDCNTVELFNMLKEGLYKPTINNEVQENLAVDNNEAMVEELQKTLSQNKELQDKLVGLQEKLSVSYAKESKLNEEIDKQKNAISNLRKGATQVIALNRKVKSLEKNNELLESKLKDSETSVNRLRESNKVTRDKNKSLRESISNRDNSNQKLNEELSNLKNTNKNLTEELESLKKDIEIKKSEYSKKLEQSNQLVEKYKRIAAKSVDKYIGLQALKIGVTSEEIKNKLPESYTFKDIDEACESVKQYRVNINRLPFNAMLNESKNIQIKATPSKNEKLAISSLNEDDDVDDMLMRMANM